ncbi:MAG: ATPase [Lachnospiraceae bacterium]|nr:ATPase [Lachnospiraceae bacterium]
MLDEKQKIETQIDSIQSQLKNFPKGNFFCSQNGRHYKWYRSDGSTHTYIPKKKRHLAEQLALKKYLTLLSNDLLREKNAIDFYLRHHHPSEADKMLTEMPEYQKLLSPYFQPLSQELLNWAQSPFESNPKYPENLTQKASSGNLVRSKSEALIDMALYVNKVPFRYECALQLGTTIIYPDFTIRHPQTGEYFYWEHFGLMDDPTYCKNVCSKLQLYASYNIIPTIQLITTYETKEHPLNAKIIEKIVQDYFL